MVDASGQVVFTAEKLLHIIPIIGIQITLLSWLTPTTSKCMRNDLRLLQQYKLVDQKERWLS